MTSIKLNTDITKQTIDISVVENRSGEGREIFYYFSIHIPQIGDKINIENMEEKTVIGRQWVYELKQEPVRLVGVKIFVD